MGPRVRVGLALVVVLGGFAAAGALLVGIDDGGCGPATWAEARAASERYLVESGASPGSDPGVNGHHVGQEDGRPVLRVLVSDGVSAGRPDCFAGVPVRYQQGGPFQAH